jgi:hypothetical protein
MALGKLLTFLLVLISWQPQLQAAKKATKPTNENTITAIFDLVF